jgi:hypothetical protein
MTTTTETKETMKKTGPTDEILPAGADGQINREGRVAVWSSKYGKAKSFRIGSQLYVQRRADSIDEEFSNIDDTHRLAHAFQHLAGHGHSLAWLVRYEAGLNRALDRAFKQLILLQSAARPSSVGHVGSFRNPRPQPTPPPPIIEKGRGSTPINAAWKRRP